MVCPPCKWRHFRRQEYDKTATLADFSASDTEEMSGHCLSNIDMEDAGHRPLTSDFTKKRRSNRDLARLLVFGANAAREGGMFLTLLRSVTRCRVNSSPYPFGAHLRGGGDDHCL